MAKNLIAARKVQSAKHGISTDRAGFPNADSLREWHRKNNPHLFNDVPLAPAREGFSPSAVLGVVLILAPVVLTIVLIAFR